MSTYEANRYAFPASAIASGTLADARIPDLATSKITSGTFADARFAASNITQHVDLTNLDASNLTSGTVPDARVGSSSVTQHVTAVADARGSWSPGTSDHSFTHSQAKYVKVGRLCHVAYRGKFNSYTSNTPENNQFYFTGLPFTSWTGGHHVGGGFGIYPGWGSVMTQVDANSTRVYLTLTSGDEFKSRTTYGNKGRMSKYYSSYPQVLNRPTDSRHIYWECTYITAS